jgi:tRNA threonylcarbamoyladenosine modification (KEOPS) complex Cgi121 subunit
LIEKNGKYDEKIVILGFKNVSITNMNNFLKKIKKETNNIIIQFFDAKKVAGFQHIYFAAYNALNSFKKKSNISKNLAIESLLYASAQRQIKKAMEIFGIKPETSEIVVLIILKNITEKEDCIELISTKIPGERDDDVLLIDKNKLISIRKLFEISDIEFEAKLKKQGFEIEALIDLIIERMALLVT